jgi:2-polyprenyl-3-methyl-5-hydroxy-6-metoxy-1,4-benzoquinol methylase
MGQYDDKVERQRVLLQAEEWAKSVKSAHAHSLNSMWYDTRPQDTEEGKSVLDIEYNSGLIERQTHDGYTVYFGDKLNGDELIQAYSRSTA